MKNILEKNILEKIIEDKSYEELGNWCLPSLSNFSDTKKLFEYQNQAIRNIKKYFMNILEKEKENNIFLIYINLMD